ncbi:MAG: response regulator transcription factor [Firmicutes bacterium]|nr:response regulator transcription factor [Bacillota bacterium]
MSKILIVDDDPDIREVLSVLLGSEGYVVEQAEDGMVALEKVKKEKDIQCIILDVMMPGMSGVEACMEMRKITLAPILFLTAKSQDQDKVDAYSGGGDDYLVKPFSKVELLMKVKSLLRRYREYQKGYGPSKATLGDNISIDIKTRCAIKNGKKIPLTDKEYDILQFFMEHRGEVVETKALYEGVWGEKYLTSAGNTIMVHILNLRKKLEEDVNKPKLIKTVWGKGYMVE